MIARRLWAAAWLLCACGDDDASVDASVSDVQMLDAADAGTDAGDPCDGTDSDGDGLPDSFEGEEDIDDDGLPNSQDDDSDGDGVLDSEEAWEEGMACPFLADCDGDEIADAYDVDSDGDGVPDMSEEAGGRCNVDTNGDGCGDYAELLFGGCEGLVEVDLITGEIDAIVVEFEALALDTPRASATLEVADGSAPLPDGLVTGVSASSAAPPDSAMPAGEAFVDANAGAMLGFKVDFDPSETHVGPTYGAWLILRDADGGELQRAGLLISVER